MFSWPFASITKHDSNITYDPNGLDVKHDVDKLKNMKVGTEEFNRQYESILDKIGNAYISFDNSQLLLMKDISEQPKELQEKIVELVIERYENRNKQMICIDGIRKINL